MAAERTFASYRELNKFNTPDYFENKKKRKMPDQGPFYEAGSVATRKISKGKVNIVCFLQSPATFQAELRQF